MAESAALDLGALGVQLADEVQASARGRVLVYGDGKIGKSTAIASTAPRPLIINCDIGASLKYAAEMDKRGPDEKFIKIDAFSRAQWRKAQDVARKLVEADRIDTVVVDTASLLCESLFQEIKPTVGDNKYELYDELEAQLTGGIRRMCNLDAHLIVVTHVIPDYADKGEGSGSAPLIKGKSKVLIPALVEDWVRFDFVQGRVPYERAFLVGPQPNWGYGARNARRSCVVAPTVPALFEELRIPL